MRLLISVRSAVEASQAVAGGADIIDAKEPAHGSLGPVAPEQLSDILAYVPDDFPLSLALGDQAQAREVRQAISSLGLPRRNGPVFVKLGFAGVDSRATAARLLAAAVAAAQRHDAHPRVIAVAYADAKRAGSLDPRETCELAALHGCAGVLLDTHLKDGRGLLACMTAEALAGWIGFAKSLGLLTAIAGQLGPADLPLVSSLAPDVVGFRGAACEGGRGGVVTAERVQGLSIRVRAPEVIGSAIVGSLSLAARGEVAKRRNLGDFFPGQVA